ncbi:MAG: FIST C-terminal domain-containing protein [Firmicutes bacterium]|nr:FIST C-terminal domain-containing protein [Bacillota bacterium]
MVRDPIRAEDEGGIALVGEIPENSVVIILEGDPESLISAAGEAAGQALARFREQTGSSGRGALVIDCISRVLYLGSDIDRELRTIRSNIPPDLPLFGFLSLGEIASAGDRYLEFYNKTTVVGIG